MIISFHGLLDRKSYTKGFILTHLWLAIPVILLVFCYYLVKSPSFAGHTSLSPALAAAVFLCPFFIIYLSLYQVSLLTRRFRALGLSPLWLPFIYYSGYFLLVGLLVCFLEPHHIRMMFQVQEPPPVI